MSVLERGRWKLEEKEKAKEKRRGDHYAIVFEKLKHSRSCLLRTRCGFTQNCSKVQGSPRGIFKVLTFFISCYLHPRRDSLARKH